MMSGWANYFNLGQIGPAYRAVDRHAIRAAATVVLSEAQGAIGGIRAFSRPTAVEAPRPYAPGADDQVPSVGEGVIPTESPVRENRTPGSTSRGWKRTYGRRTMHRRESVRRMPRTLRAPRQPLTLPGFWLPPVRWSDINLEAGVNPVARRARENRLRTLDAGDRRGACGVGRGGEAETGE